MGLAWHLAKQPSNPASVLLQALWVCCAADALLVRRAQVRFVFRCINLVCTFLMTSPYRYNILSGNRARLRYARSRFELAAEVSLFFCLASASALLALVGAARLAWLSLFAGPRLAMRFLGHPLTVIGEACDFLHLCYLYWQLASGYVRSAPVCCSC